MSALAVSVHHVLMGLSGVMRPARNAVGEPKTTQYIVWSRIHPMLGRTLVVLAVFDVYLGWKALGADLVPLIAFTGLLGVGVLFQVLFVNWPTQHNTTV